MATPASAVNPPDGFVLENSAQQNTPANLPDGFVLENQSSSEPDKGFLGGAYDTAVAPIVQMIQHPVQTAASLPGQIASGEKAMWQNADQVVKDPKSSLSDKIDSGIYLLPGIGPTLKHMDDLNKQGKHAEAYGEMSGLMAAMLGPKIVEGVAPTVADAIDATSAKVSPRVSNMMNQFVGLNSSDLPKYERFNPGSPEEIGNTAYQESKNASGKGLHNNLTAQKSAIDTAIQNRLDNQTNLVKNASSTYANPVDMQHILADSAANLTDELQKSEGDSARLKAVENNWIALDSKYGKTMPLSDAVAMRNQLRKSITDWNPKSTNVDQRFYQDVYHAINDEVESKLSPQDAVNFRLNNRAMNRLIIASNAAGEKLTKGAMKYDTPVKSIAKAASPSKWADLVPNDKIIPKEAAARQTVANGLNTAANVTRLAGDPASQGLQRFVTAPDLVPQQQNQ